jgi:DGQHR domain-containing protein
MDEIKVPCIKTQQNAQKHLYSFVVDGKRIPQFATVSRVARDEEGQLVGYQRPEVQDHINDIRGYIERADAILPNSIVIAFQDKLNFEEIERIDEESSVGTLRIFRF